VSGVLRVVDAGLVPAIRSQSLWHGIASAMRPGDPPVLSLCTPAQPYVCIGFHRRLSELDLEACSALALPIYRRQIGGGPVYCDSDQLFFQLTMPAAGAPASVDRLYSELLSPAATAMRSLGLDARLADVNEIVVGDRKLSGTGAGRIGDAVTVVGNVIFRFPHDVMARVLALPDEAVRTEFLRLLRRYVSSLEDEGLPAVSVADARDALVAAYSETLGLEALVDEPSRRELRAMAAWERRLEDVRWLRGPAQLPAAPRSVKVRAGVLLAI
jgi:lipoate---protein ligase